MYCGDPYRMQQRVNTYSMLILLLTNQTPVQVAMARHAEYKGKGGLTGCEAILT